MRPSVMLAVALALQPWLPARPLRAASPPRAGLAFHVAPGGDDANPGTPERPIATFERARLAARQARLAGSAPEPMEIILHAGRYFLSRTFELDASDSGSPGAPFTVRNAPGEAVTLCGARALRATDFQPVTNAVVLARLAPEVRGRMRGLDLVALDIAHRKAAPNLYADHGGLPELYVDGRRMPLARYPNDGYLTMRRVRVNGGGSAEPGRWGDPALKQSPKGAGVFEYRDDRHQRWVEAARRGELWFKGYWRCVWQNEAVRVAEINPAEQTVTLAVPVPGGIGSKYHRPEGDGQERYWVRNLLEEIDQPGEWCVVPAEGRLYLLPPAGWERADLLLADLAAPVVRLLNTSNVVLRGLTVEGSLDHGIVVQGGASNLIAGCTVRNVTRYGVKIDGGRGHTVQSCDIHDTGAGGVWLGGGDERATPRVPAGHRVANCHIHHFGCIELVYAPGINAGFTGGGGGGHHVAVGMTVEHNLIHDGPHAGVLFGSWDSVFAFNDVSAYCQLSNDMGGFYCYDRAERSGGHRICFNHVHDTTQGDGIYFDFDHNGSQVYGNVVDLGSTGRWGTAFLYKTGNQAQRPQPVCCSNNIARRSAAGFNFITPRPGAIANNIAAACEKPFAWQEVKDGRFVRADARLAAGSNVAYRADPGFVTGPAPDRALQPGAQVLKDLPGFQAIPFGRIGLYRDAYRTRLPDSPADGAAKGP